MLNYIHIYEKCFFLTRNKSTYYVFPDEKLPYHHTQSKCYIPKIMFMVAVARPQYNRKKRELFDGKIRIWPFCGGLCEPEVKSPSPSWDDREDTVQGQSSKDKGDVGPECAPGYSCKDSEHMKEEYNHSAGQCPSPHDRRRQGTHERAVEEWMED